MTPKEYIKKAIRTESTSPPINVAKVKATFAVLRAYWGISDIVDMSKKHQFYDKQYDISHDEMQYRTTKIVNDLDAGTKNSPQAYVSPTDNSTNVPVYNTTNFQIRMYHAMLGLCTESGEIATLYDKLGTAELSPKVKAKFVDETGDILWYLAIMFDALGVTFEQVMEKNIVKLKTRFPNKFTNEKAINKDTTVEQRVVDRSSE